MDSSVKCRQIIYFRASGNNNNDSVNQTSGLHASAQQSHATVFYVGFLVFMPSCTWYVCVPIQVPRFIKVKRCVLIPNPTLVRCTPVAGRGQPSGVLRAIRSFEGRGAVGRRSCWEKARGESFSLCVRGTVYIVTGYQRNRFC